MSERNFALILYEAIQFPARARGDVLEPGEARAQQSFELRLAEGITTGISVDDL
jgi:hypothetical protein